jgi:CheY-like chemotaxis protein
MSEHVKPMEPLILLVDDFEDNRSLYAEFLSYQGYRVVEAADGLEALERAFALLPDLIVMDLSLPGLDGWEATRRLKKDGRTCAIPIVALSGHGVTGHARGAREAGCDSFVTKPCLPDALIAEVRRVLAARATRG